MKARTSLFRAVLRAVLAGLLLAVASAAWLGYAWVLRPLAERSADDFAALLLLSASSYAELPEASRGEFIENLFQQHQLRVTPVARPLSAEPQHHPYLRSVAQRLAPAFRQT